MGSIKKHKKLNILFFDDMIKIKDLNPDLLKQTKSSTKSLIFITLGISQLKILII